MKNIFEDAEVISAYTWDEAIADGQFIEVTETAKEAGITIPTAVTASVYHRYVACNPMPDGSDLKGRLWDTVWTFSRAAKGKKTSMIEFVVAYWDGIRNKDVTLWATLGARGPNDSSPIITIMLPEDY